MSVGVGGSMTPHKMVVAALLLFMASLHTFLFFQRRSNTAALQQADQRPRKLILSWTGFFKHPRFMTPSLEALGCPVHDCDVTSDRTRVNESQALVFHWFNVNASDLPARKLPGQRWVMMSFESPLHAPRQLDSLSAMEPQVDWTVTYSSASDFPSPYGRVRVRLSSDPPLPADTGPSSPSLRKKRPVSWMVSHCRTSSKRELLVKELKKSIPVDVYGRCNGNLALTRWSKRKAYKFLAKRYTFYLSLENALCREYLTEKVFFPLLHGMIPVVLGGADYQHLLPPGSYVDVSHFSNASHLAAHLVAIRDDPSLYSSYFRWRRRMIVSKPQNNNDFFCRICRELRDPRTGNAPSSSGDKFRFWRNSGSECLTVENRDGLNLSTLRSWTNTAKLDRFSLSRRFDE